MSLESRIETEQGGMWVLQSSGMIQPVRAPVSRATGSCFRGPSLSPRFASEQSILSIAFHAHNSGPALPDLNSNRASGIALHKARDERGRFGRVEEFALLGDRHFSSSSRSSSLRMGQSGKARDSAFVSRSPYFRELESEVQKRGQLR